jgi:hypothetical protein
MDEARRVIERLEHIERLRGIGAPADTLLVEVRGLLEDGERWLAAERPEGLDEAQAALERCRSGLDLTPEASTTGAKEVVARSLL